MITWTVKNIVRRKSNPPMPKQESLCLYGKGIYKTKAGHLRYHSPVDLRGKYVHREMIRALIEETPYSIKLLLPYPYEVHHIDYNKEHNCSCNFLIVSEALHSVMTADRVRHRDGTFSSKFHPKWKPPPEWRLFEDSIEEVPF